MLPWLSLRRKLLPRLQPDAADGIGATSSCSQLSGGGGAGGGVLDTLKRQLADLKVEHDALVSDYQAS